MYLNEQLPQTFHWGKLYKGKSWSLWRPHCHGWATGGHSCSPSQIHREADCQSPPPSGEWWSQHSLSPSSFPCSSPQDGGLLICLVGAWLPREPVSLLDEMTGHSSPVAGRLVLFDHPGSGKDSPLLLLSLSTDLFGRACSTRRDTCHSLCVPAPPALQKQPWNWHWVDWRLPSRFSSLCKYKGFYLAWEAGDTILA